MKQLIVFVEVADFVNRLVAESFGWVFDRAGGTDSLSYCRKERGQETLFQRKLPHKGTYRYTTCDGF